MRQVNLQIPKKFKGLFDRGKWRNKVFYGGRGGAKSHNFARAILILGMGDTLRIACAREIQKSIKDSVYQLLVDIIRQNGLDAFYTIQADRIIGKNGTQIYFLGLKHNITGIKSLEGVDIFWVEEAENVSAQSWETVIPTIRKPNSEIWVSFNPKNPTDPTWKKFVESADSDTLLQKVSWVDNPFFPEVLEKERVKLLHNDPEAHKHVWEGEFDTRHTGYVYANRIMKIKEKGQVTHVPCADGVPVFTVWDLGNADATAIWFVQIVGYQVRVIDFFEDSNEGLSYYSTILREKGYDYGFDYLPHDAGHERLGMDGSIQSQLKGMGRKVRVLNNNSIQGGIEKARSLVNECWFDEEKCHDGIHALNNYRYEWDENRNMFKDKPLHDWSSHASDAFRYLSFAVEIERRMNITTNNPIKKASNSGLKTTRKFQKIGKKGLR